MRFAALPAARSPRGYPHLTSRVGWQAPPDNSELVDIDHRMKLGELGMKVRRRMLVSVEHDLYSIHDRDGCHTSQIQHQPRRIFQAFLDAHQKRHGFLAV